MAGLLSCDKEDTDKVVKNVGEVRASGIDVLAARRQSRRTTTSASSKSRTRPRRARCSRRSFASAWRPSKASAKARSRPSWRRATKTATFKDVFDFCKRVDLKRVNKKVLEALIKSGAFDGLHPQSNRAAMLASLESAVDEAQKVARERESGQATCSAASRRRSRRRRRRRT